MILQGCECTRLLYCPTANELICTAHSPICCEEPTEHMRVEDMRQEHMWRFHDATPDET